ncbi:MAG: ATP-binding cassette domain-containing protein [Helicobacteraceae bacterium]
MLRKLLSILSKREKIRLAELVVLSVFVSLVETISVSIIMPFISVASNFELISANKYYNAAYKILDLSSPLEFVLIFGLLLVAFYIMRTLVNVLYFYAMARFSKGRYHALAFRLFEAYLGMSYKNFIHKNSSTLTKTIINEAGNLTTIIGSFLLIISEMFVVLFIYAMMLYVNYKITLLLTLILSINALFMLKILTPKLKQAGNKREQFQKSFYEIINSSFGNFKMLKLFGNTRAILKNFEASSINFAKANIYNETMQSVPRLVLETLGFVILIFIVVFLVLKYEQDISAAMALISMFVLGLYRLMPSANRILINYNTIVFYRNSLDIVHTDILYDTEELKDRPLEFKSRISLLGVNFSYDDAHPVLQGVDLEIRRGQRVAFIGESGSGKSTLVDIISGLFRPTSGLIKIDGIPLDESNIRSWRKKIGYIPQSVYLFDGTVAQNVCFGGEFNASKIKTALRQAKILEFLENHHNGIDTIVGENGILLSGGQRQRIAIARALYQDPEILVLDEATSALDNETESKIMEEIYAICSDKTLIIIAHRLSTTSGCDTIYEIKNAKLVLSKGKENV